ncbi:hypothetical protein D3C78_929770 [compost metagenome]
MLKFWFFTFSILLVTFQLPSSVALSALVSTHVFAMTGAEIKQASAVKANVFFIILPFLLNRLFLSPANLDS